MSDRQDSDKRRKHMGHMDDKRQEPTLTPEKAQELLDHYEQVSFAGIVSVDYVSGFLRAYIAQAAEIGRLKAIIRVNGLRAGATHAEIDAVINGDINVG